MTSKIIIRTLEVGESYKGELLVKECTKRDATNGPFINMVLTDGVDTVIGRRWKCSTAVAVGTVINTAFTVDSYQGVINLNIKSIAAGQIDYTEFLAKGPFKASDTYDLLMKQLEYIHSADYYKIAHEVLRRYREQFMTAVAAKSVHHEYVGGLIQHMYEVTILAADNASSLKLVTDNKDINMDLVLVGALVHDIGKLRGYTEANGVGDLTDEGKFMEHIILGCIELSKICDEQGIHPRVKQLLLHCVASHHGKLEFGSPVKPVCIEAYIIHQADMLSTQASIMQHAKADNSDWTAKNFFTGGPIYKGEKDFSTDEDRDYMEGSKLPF